MLTKSFVVQPGLGCVDIDKVVKGLLTWEAAHAFSLTDKLNMDSFVEARSLVTHALKWISLLQQTLHSEFDEDERFPQVAELIRLAEDMAYDHRPHDGARVRDILRNLCASEPPNFSYSLRAL